MTPKAADSNRHSEAGILGDVRFGPSLKGVRPSVHGARICALSHHIFQWHRQEIPGRVFPLRET